MTLALQAIDSVPVGDAVSETLEQVLERAKAGELSMVAIAAVERDGTHAHAWSFLHNTATLVGSIELMKHAILAKHHAA